MAVKIYFVRAAKALASLHICTLGFGTVPKSHVLPQMVLFVLFTLAAKTLVSMHICAGIVTGQCVTSIKISCASSEGFGESTQGRLNHRHSNEISCAGSNGDLCTVYMKSKCCGESAPATTAHLCNNQCAVSMRQIMLLVACNKIPQ